MSERAFGSGVVREKARDYHGGARFLRVKPDVGSRGVKSLNIDLGFEEALKLSLALDSCLQALNRYNRSTTKGRGMGLVLAIKLDNSSVSVIEAAVKSRGPSPQTSE
jgi:hypothetical protein